MNNKIRNGLSVLFMTELWERFGFYIVQGLLALYMTQNFNFTDRTSYSLLGAFTALAYIAPVIGGYLADKLLGFIATIILGGILLCIGYAILAINHLSTFYLALAIIVAGTGFLKPNISGLVGTLYAPNDPQRETGFTIFYVGIYIGVLLSTLTSGYVHVYFGWSTSFSLASIGMVIALMIFVSGKSKLTGRGENVIPSKKPLVRVLSYTSLIIFISCLFAWFIIKYHEIANITFVILSSVLSGMLFFLILRYKAQQRKNLALLLILFVFSTIFWALYFQTFFSLTLFIERNVERHFWGMTIPTIAFLSIIPVCIIIFGPLLAKMWANLKLKNRDFKLATKFGLGLIFTGLGFLIITLGTVLPNANGLISPVWILISYFLITAGELFISPIGLSMVTELAPNKLVGVLMGYWFFSLGIGGQFAGVIAKWTALPQGLESLSTQVAIYQHGFLTYAILGIASGLVLLIGNHCYDSIKNHVT